MLKYMHSYADQAENENEALCTYCGFMRPRIYPLDALGGYAGNRRLVWDLWSNSNTFSAMALQPLSASTAGTDSKFHSNPVSALR